MNRTHPGPRLAEHPDHHGRVTVLLLDQGTDAARARAEPGWYPSHPSLTDEFRYGSYRQ